MNREENNRRISRIARGIATGFGFTEAKAEFTAFKDFKVKWVRSKDWISFDISDYLEDAPEDVLRELLDTIFRKIRGEDPDYTENVNAWLTAPEFARIHGPVYRRRVQGTSEGTKGANVDLAESYERLIESGLVERDEDIAIRWGKTPARFTGRSSVLMKSIFINDKLDNEGISENALDFVLYSEICGIGRGFGAGRKSIEEHEDVISRFGGHENARSELRRLGMAV